MLFCWSVGGILFLSRKKYTLYVTYVMKIDEEEHNVLGVPVVEVRISSLRWDHVMRIYCVYAQLEHYPFDSSPLY
jgi:hypothetical protein